MKVFIVTAFLILIISFPLFSGGQADAGDMAEGSMMEKEEMEVNAIVEFKSLSQAKQLASEKPTVLFFNASWCPSCKGAVKDFRANESKLKDYYLVLVDYDDSDDLQKKYGVSYQHTFVQIDTEGEAVTKWNGGGTSELIEKAEVM